MLTTVFIITIGMVLTIIMLWILHKVSNIDRLNSVYTIIVDTYNYVIQRYKLVILVNKELVG